MCAVLCRAVCRELWWPLIDKDDARDCLQQLPASVDANQLSYDIMFSYANTQLQLGLSTALDCPFARVCLYERAQGLARQVGSGGQRAACSWCAQLELRGAAASGWLEHCVTAACLCAAAITQHGAVVAVVECIASDAAAWRQQLESRAAQQQVAEAHKPQTWEDLQQLLQGYVLLLARSCALNAAHPDMSAPGAAAAAAEGTETATSGPPMAAARCSTTWLSTPQAALCRTRCSRYWISCCPCSRHE